MTTPRSDLLAWARRLFGLALCCAWLAAAAAPAWAQAPDAQPSPAASLEGLKTSLDEVEAIVGREDAGADALGELRHNLNGSIDRLRDKIGELEPQAADLEARLKQLGPVPAANAPPESPDIADERERLGASFGAVDGALKQARLLALRADQLSERVSEKRHALYARELFARTASVLDPHFWVEAADAVPLELARLRAIGAYWQASVLQKASRARLIAAAAALLGIVALAAILTRWLIPRVAAGVAVEGRFAKARAALSVFFLSTMRTPGAAFAAVLAFEALGLLTMRLEQIGEGVVLAVLAAAFGRGVARGLFAPERPERRLMRLDDGAAHTLSRYLVWTSRALALAILLQVVHKALHAPLIVTVTTNALFACITAAFLVSLMVDLRRAERAAGACATIAAAAPGVYPAALLVTAAICVALVAGYAAAAAFLALRVIVAAAVFGALYLFLVATKALFSGLAENTPRGRALAANLGLSPRALGLFGALLSAAIRLVLVVFACLLIIGPWEVSTADLFDTVRNIPFGFKIGEINVSFRAILAAAVVLVLLIALTRVAQRWLETELLPRTSLEPSLQLSIATIFGYLGVILAIALALAALGIDLQKIALVAGALSVGIGFGLQSIVSNFVSGLILLAERPIRIGDSIVVKGEEGWVRRVRVRATEIETFDRASVIIPNSELITGVVKNWTHANTLGRIVVKLGVAYDSDPEAVREALAAVATGHPQVVRAPAPAVLLTGFGDSALNFELRCVVANVESAAAVKSDLHFAILKRFRELGIEMPFPQRELRWRPDGRGAEAEVVRLGAARSAS